MVVDAESCWKAARSRDRRFEGRFVLAVRTTGVYCRPGCPAPIPLRANVRFFACAAGAEEAGFRPCLRCRPDASPESPVLQGTSRTVARALRLIAEGGWDEGGVEALAERLGLGARQLRRLFAEELGASPLRIARTQRVHFARKLLDETALPLTEVALGAGFTSVRRFNQAIRETFHRTPTELRKKRAPPSEHGDSEELYLKLPYKPPLDWQHFADFLSPRAIAGVESFENGVYRRTLDIDGAEGTLSVQNPGRGARHLLLSARVAPGPALHRVVGRIRRLFDLDCDPDRIATDLGSDHRLGQLISARPGLRVPGAWDGFEIAVRAILGQQVTVRGASTLSARLVASLGRPVRTGVPGLTHLFPEPKRFADADLERIGIPHSRANALRALASAVVKGELRLNGASASKDVEAVLIALPGIGRWTAAYIALRVLGEPDAFPAGDLGLRKAIVPGKLVSERETREHAEAWRPWRAYAAMYLWSTLK